MPILRSSYEWANEDASNGTVSKVADAVIRISADVYTIVVAAGVALSVILFLIALFKGVFGLQAHARERAKGEIVTILICVALLVTMWSIILSLARYQV